MVAQNSTKRKRQEKHKVESLKTDDLNGLDKPSWPEIRFDLLVGSSSTVLVQFKLEGSSLVRPGPNPTADLT